MSGYSLGEPYGHGHSFQQLVRGVTPAAGASFSLVNSGFFRSRLIGCVFTVTTDANAANRYFTVEKLLDDNTPFLIGAAGLVVTANQSATRFAGSMFRGVAEWATGTDIMFPLLPVWFEEGETLKINVAAVQAGDTLTLIRLLFDRYPTAEDWFYTGAEQ